MHSYYSYTGRRIFFWSLVMLYIAIISVLIPFAFGYHFSFERGVFVYAGSITIKANPRNVRITLDNRPVKNVSYINNTYHINGVAPGDHTIDIMRDGFQFLTKDLTVSSGVSTELWNIILPRTHYQRTIIGTVPSPIFYRAANNALFATPHVQDGKLSITITDATTQDRPTQKTITVPTRTPTIFSPVQNVEWSHDAKMLIVPVSTKDLTTDIYRTDAIIVTIDGASHWSLRNLFPEAQRITAVRWNPHANNILYAQIDNTLVEITLPQNRRKDVRTALIANDVRTYTIANDALYYLAAQTGIVNRVTPNTTTHRQITATPTQIASDENVTLTVYDDDRLVIRGNTSGLLEVFDRTFAQKHTLHTNIRGTQFSDDGKKLLYWNDQEIHVLFLRQWNVQPLRNAGSDATIARFSMPVTNVQWVRDYEHVLYTVDDTIKLTSLDERGGRSTHSLLKGHDLALMRADAAHYRLYFTEKTDTGATFSFINFPEKEGLF